MRFLDMFKDDKTGQYSLARISAALVLAGSCAWAGYISIKTTTFVDIPTGWLTIVLGLYGINKITSNATGDK